MSRETEPRPQGSGHLPEKQLHDRESGIIETVANKEHLEILKQGVEAWNRWREENPDVWPDLRGADLRRANLRGADLRGADLREADLRAAILFRANLREANLRRADLSGAILSRANLREANLREADLYGADLSRANLFSANLRRTDLSEANLREADPRGADLREAHLFSANLSMANLREADLTAASLLETVFGDTHLSRTKGLESCTHHGPSTIDHRTLAKSGKLPLKFLRGVGLPEFIIDNIPVLQGDPIQFYSCFISYSSKDQEFAERLHADLQNEGVRCWFAPEDLKIGARTRPAIDEAIRVRDKLLLILSEKSIESDWVEKEVETAFEEESRRKETVLFPIRLDNTVMETDEAWAADIRRTRNIGDFRDWKHHDSYQKTFERLIRDLKQEWESGAAA